MNRAVYLWGGVVIVAAELAVVGCRWEEVYLWWWWWWWCRWAVNTMSQCWTSDGGACDGGDGNA